MSATLNIKNSFSIVVKNKTIEGWHGTDAANNETDNFSVTVDGKVNYQPSLLTSGTGRTLWDDDEDAPADFDFMFFCADQDIDLQIIAATLNVTIRVKAGIPFVLGYDDILAAIATTVQTGGATPAYEEIDSINISNRSGTDANYVFFCVD